MLNVVICIKNIKSNFVVIGVGRNYLTSSGKDQISLIFGSVDEVTIHTYL